MFRTISSLLALAFIGSFATNAQALTINADNCAVDPNCYEIATNSNLTTSAEVIAAAALAGLTITSPIELYYKNNSNGTNGGAEDIATFRDNYATLWDSPTDEPSGGTVSHTGGAAIQCPDCYLIVKDGSQGDPAQYIFNLALWNGTEDIVLSGFWDGAGVQGAISNLAIWGDVSPIPVPAAFWLFGSALIGFVGMSRKIKV